MIFSPGDSVRQVWARVFASADCVRRVADELAIREVIALIARYADDGSLEAYSALFTPDARWEMPGVRVREGREDIVAAGAERRAAGVAGPGSRTLHQVSALSVAVTGDSAVAMAYWQFHVNTDAVPTVRLAGHYRDTFRRTADGWLLHHRQITVC
jgi:uncharacterized protein (TIGR02246 family)